MTYTYTNSRGTQYFLNTKQIERRGNTGKTLTIYYFSKDERDTGCELPDGKTVVENAKSGLPVLKKAV